MRIASLLPLLSISTLSACSFATAGTWVDNDPDAAAASEPPEGGFAEVMDATSAIAPANLEAGTGTDASNGAVDGALVDAPADAKRDVTTVACSSGTAETEPNDTSATANLVTKGGCGTLGPGEVDMFAFDVPRAVTVSLHAPDQVSATLVAPGGTQQSSVRVGNDTTLAGASATAGRFQLRLSVPQAAQSAAYSFELKLR